MNYLSSLRVGHENPLCDGALAFETGHCHKPGLPSFAGKLHGQFLGQNSRV
jgi:hypothetical protein